MSFTKEQWQCNGEMTVFSISSAGKTGHPNAKGKVNLDSDLISFTKTNSKCITELSVKCKTIHPLEDDIGENPADLEFGNDFLNKKTKSMSHRRKKLIKLDLIKVKNFCSAKEN